MKKFIISIFLILTFSFVFCEEFTVKTGDVFGLSMFDYFTPVESSVSGCRTCVSSIKKVEKDLWCITLISDSKSNQFPKYFEYYVKPGDIISVIRFPDIKTKVQLQVKSVEWNTAVLEVVE